MHNPDSAHKKLLQSEQNPLSCSLLAQRSRHWALSVEPVEKPGTFDLLV